MILSVRWPRFEPEVFDVGAAGLADAQPVQTQEHGERGVGG
jgi:hypothetical protein